MQVQIVTPERSWDPIESTSVVLPAHDGQWGVLPRHAPTVMLLGEGVLRLHHESAADDAYALKGGVAEVGGDQITILAEAVSPLNEVSEADLVKRLQELDGADYDPSEPAEKAKAKTEAHWIATQLKSAGKDVPELKQF